MIFNRSLNFPELQHSSEQKEENSPTHFLQSWFLHNELEKFIRYYVKYFVNYKELSKYKDCLLKGRSLKVLKGTD